MDGFSDAPGRRLWMGLENAHRLTLNSTMRLHVVMTGPNGTTGSIQYPGFRVYDDQYNYAFSNTPHQRAKETGWRINTGEEVIQPTIV